MGAVKSCCHHQIDEKLLVTKMDLSHCGCLEVPPVVFSAERCIETLILASNQITSLPPQLFHCQEMKHLNLSDNCLSCIPPAIESFQSLVSLKLDKNNLQDLPDNLKICKKLKRLNLNNNPWKQMPNVVTQLISLEELYLNDCELSYLPASVGRLSKLKIMELRNNNLCNLPLSMTRLEMLTRLDISDNEFSDFPPCISKLKALTELLLDNNDLEEIMDIKNLIYLEHLDASYNHISNVSETIGCCIYLNMLNLSYNYIEQLPNSIGNISHLQTLHLEMNELTELPKSIGKLLNLEELNLCNNKLYSLPNTIGLLRNLRNLNVSRNMIEEFPPEIGSCTKLAIINAAYNRLQVLPPEIGYLNNLKVLDLVGNFLMYLPITIINLHGVRAIWLSANQNIPLIPFTEDLNLASGERFLTNIALPQLGEITLRESQSPEKKVEGNEKNGTWSKKIRFAEDDNLVPGKLHRTPTPFPKELRAPNRKGRGEELKSSENYANLVDGKVNDQEVPLLQSPSVCVPKGGSGVTFSDGCLTRIREANIRRNNKDVDYEPSSVPDVLTVNSANYGSDSGIVYHDHHTGEIPKPMEPSISLAKSEVLSPVETNQSTPETESNNLQTTKEVQNQIRVNGSADCSGKETAQCFSSEEKPSPHSRLEETTPQIDGFDRSIIYSNLLNNEKKRTNEMENALKIGAQGIREIYQNNVVLRSSKNSNQNLTNTSLESLICYYNREDPRVKYVSMNTSTHRNFVRMSSINSNHSDCRRLYATPPPPPPPLSNNGNHQGQDCTPRHPYRSHSRSSSQDYISLAEQMKNRNIPPPCYEVAKMYSTKAALFENNHIVK